MIRTDLRDVDISYWELIINGQVAAHSTDAFRHICQYAYLGRDFDLLDRGILGRIIKWVAIKVMEYYD